MMPKRVPLLVLGIFIIVGSGWAHGLLIDRWGMPVDVNVAAENLDKIPHEIGNWYSVPVEVPQGQLEAAEAVGSFSRAYRNRDTNENIRVWIACGRHGPIAVHPPTICFVNSGQKQLKAEESHSLGEPESANSFWKATFVKRTPEGLQDGIRTFWAWSVDGTCVASDNPRTQFAGEPYLYKIYVIRPMEPEAASTEEEVDDRVDDFLKRFLPVFRSAIGDTDEV